MSTSLSVERRLVRALYEAATHARVAGLPGMAEDLDRHRVAAEANVIAQEREQRRDDVPELDGDGLRRLLSMPTGTRLLLTLGGRGPRNVMLDHVAVFGAQVRVDLLDVEDGTGYTLTRRNPEAPLEVRAGRVSRGYGMGGGGVAASREGGRGGSSSGTHLAHGAPFGQRT